MRMPDRVHFGFDREEMRGRERMQNQRQRVRKRYLYEFARRIRMSLRGWIRSGAHPSIIYSIAKPQLFRIMSFDQRDFDFDQVCEDINECLEMSNQCAFRCHNVPGSFRCICPYGYALAPDGRHCQGTQSVTALCRWVVFSVSDFSYLSVRRNTIPNNNQDGYNYARL